MAVKTKTLKQLSRFSEKDIRLLHGIGKTSISLLEEALLKEGQTFKQQAS